MAKKYKILISSLLALFLPFGILAATTDFTATSNITVSAVTFGNTTADMIIMNSSTAESWSWNSGTFTVSNPGAFKVGSADASVVTIQIHRSGVLVECTVNGTPGTSFVTLPTVSGAYTVTPSSDTICSSSLCTAVANAATLDSYPTCGAASCNAGYRLSGEGASATCVLIGGGGGSIGGRLTVNSGQSSSVGSVSTTGLNVYMYTNAQVNFNLSSSAGPENHSLKIDKLDMDAKKISIQFQSQPFYVEFSVGETKQIDVNKDGQNDIEVSFNGLLVNKIDLTVKTIPAKTTVKSPVEKLDTTKSQEGLLVSGSGLPGVYLIKNGKRQPIVSAKAFLSYGYKWSDIKTISNLNSYPSWETLMGIPTTRSLVKSASDNKVYFLAPDKVKRWVKSESVLLALNYKWSDILEVGADFLTGYQSGADITDTKVHPDWSLVMYPNSNKVYLIEAGKKRWIVSGQAFQAQNFDWNDVIKVPVGEVYGDGENFGQVEGTTVMDSFVSQLKLDSTGAEVKLLQTKLKEWGYFPATVGVSGYFGPVTVKAVKNFQSANGIDSTGAVGPQTRTALNATK